GSRLTGIRARSGSLYEVSTCLSTWHDRDGAGLYPAPHASAQVFLRAMNQEIESGTVGAAPDDGVAMATRQWTVVIVSDDDTAVRQFRLSREAFRVLIALLLFLVAGLSSLAAAFLVGAGAGRADARLVAKNQAMERELEDMTARLDTLESSLAYLSSKDEYYRLLAGLEPL